MFVSTDLVYIYLGLLTSMLCFSILDLWGMRTPREATAEFRILLTL